MTAPIIIFSYRRPEHLRHTLMSLVQCSGFADSPIIVYSDGPSTEKDEILVQKSRQVATEILGRKAHYRLSQENKGLAKSVIDGVSSVIDEYGVAIIIEDDLCLAPYFLAYMNKGLATYKDDESIFQISGYSFNVPAFYMRKSAFFLPFTTSWGWATWGRAWQNFDIAATGWTRLRHNKALRDQFNLFGTYNYADMLERQMRGELDSWAICWYWSVFCAKGHVLYPPRTLVTNEGFDGSGTHGAGKFRKHEPRQTSPLLSPPIEMPNEVGLDEGDFDLVRKAMWKQNGGWLGHGFAHINRLKRHIFR